MCLCSVLAADKSKCCETLLRLGADPNSLDGETNATCVIECRSCFPLPSLSSLTSFSPTPLFPSSHPSPSLSPPPLHTSPQSMDALHCCGQPITATQTQCAPSSNPMTPIRTLLTPMAELVSGHVNVVVFVCRPAKLCIWCEHKKIMYIHVSTSTVYTGTYIYRLYICTYLNTYYVGVCGWYAHVCKS